jgi:hypothetical protein
MSAYAAPLTPAFSARVKAAVRMLLDGMTPAEAREVHGAVVVNAAIEEVKRLREGSK